MSHDLLDLAMAFGGLSDPPEVVMQLIISCLLISSLC